MIRLFDGDRTATLDSDARVRRGSTSGNSEPYSAVVAMGSEQAINAGYTAALDKNVPLIVVFDELAGTWESLGDLGSTVRHAVRHATFRLTVDDVDTINEYVGTDDFRHIDGEILAQIPELVRQAKDIWARPAMVFHAPFEIPARANSASRVRPRKMREAFRATHRVIDLSGSPKDRARAYRELRALLRAGLRPEFAYSENSTQPNLFASPIKDGILPGLETRIFRFLKKAGIPLGQFYRDVYWKFSDKTGSRRGIKASLYTAAYTYDVKLLESIGAHVFLPSIPMASYLPELSRVSELPPGSEPVDSAQPEPLKLLYVGGLGPHYRLHLMIAAMAAHPNITLTLCVPEANWHNMRADYEPLPNNVVVRHESGEGLRQLYDETNAGVLFVEPDDYWGFAVPMKFYEYQAHGKAVVATAGTYAGKLATSAGIGEAIEYTADAIDELLGRWEATPELVRAYTREASMSRNEHTWESRARTVAEKLTSD